MHHGALHKMYAVSSSAIMQLTLLALFKNRADLWFSVPLIFFSSI